MILFRNIGSEFIGASCYYININGIGIILDCGVDPRKKGFDSFPDFEVLNDLPTDYVIISHAHQDHIGALPLLIKKFPHIKILATPQTRALAEIVLHNSVSILKKEIPDRDFLIYSHEEVDLLIKSMNYLEYEKEIVLLSMYSKTDSGIKLKFFDAGHILGSAGIYLEFNDKKIFYTGDIKTTNQEILWGAKLPEEKVDLLILETTYGSTSLNQIPKWKEEASRFAKEANKILSDGGSILIPVFALGKMQEILAMIYNLMLKKNLADVDIFVGGIGKQILRIYDLNRYITKRTDQEFELNSIPTSDYNEADSPREFFKSPSIILASSGMMLKETSSYNFALHWFKEDKSAIFIVGYMDPETPGYLISNSKKGDNIILDELNELKIRCEIKNFKFPSHSNSLELLDIVKKLKPEKIILVHGEEDSINKIGEIILKQKKEIKIFTAEKNKFIKL